MKLRVARHTEKLNRIIDFYCRISGLKILGEFKEHRNYSGVFLGYQGSDWHLEFTVSDTAPAHQPDNDDLLVLYADNIEEFELIKKRLIADNVSPVIPRNLYWLKNGITFPDPDGYLVVLSVVRA